MKNIFGGNKFLYINEILQKGTIKEGMRIGDLGCGSNGFFVYSSSKLVGNSGLVYAVDVMQNVLDDIERTVKNENYKNIKTVRSNLEVYKATKIDSMSLDLVFLVNILNQSDKKIDILREVIRLLKKSAKVIIVEWVEGASIIGPHKERKINKENLLIATQRLGLSLEEEFIAGRFHYGLVFKKI